MSIAAELSISVPVSRRQEARAATNMDARVRRMAEPAVSVDVLDLSTRGFRVRSYRKIAAGDVVWLRLPGLQPLQASILWVEDEIAGGQFSAPLHPAVFDSLVRAGG